MRPLILRPEALNDLDQARDWYEGKVPGLGDRFLDAVSAVLTEIERLPEAPAVIYRHVRYVSVRRFPYGVYYQVFADRVDVLAVVHGSRASRVWKDRLN